MVQQGKGKFKEKKEKPEFDQHILDLARVTRVTKGGKQMSFRATVLIGDRNGRVAYGVDKGKDVQIAVEKAVNQAKKQFIRIPLKNGTIPHRVEAKFKAAHIMLKPAPIGSGIIAGGATRIVLEMAGVPNVSAKTLSKTNNKITNVKATFKALSMFKKNVVKHAAPAPSAEKPVVAEAKAKKAPTKKETKKAE